MLKTNYGKKPKVIRSDRGGEYVNSKVQGYLKQEGIQIQYTVAYSPQQNGITERKNRTLMDAARSMLLESSLDECYWAEAVNHANYVQNRLIKHHLRCGMVKNLSFWIFMSLDVTFMHSYQKKNGRNLTNERES